mmetsp:Transcript_38256/g.90449  ORF Transcript_38256/g.90449 Transcript_38256/m.90449 type:complete len:214 (+) Transcript_38256:3500-4141(+)
MLAPLSIVSWRVMLALTISDKMTVRSSSLLPAPTPIATEGRMQHGGTGRCVRISSSGRECSGRMFIISTSSSGMLRKSASTVTGSMSSIALPTACFISGFFFVSENFASSDIMSSWKDFFASSYLLNLSCTSRRYRLGPFGIFLIGPLHAPQYGHATTFLHASMMVLFLDCRRKWSSCTRRMNARADAASSGTSKMREHVLQMQESTAMIALK